MRKVLPVIIIAALILCIVSANILASQLFPSLMYKVVQLNDLSATKQFLAHIEGTPYYDQQYTYFNMLFNNAFAAEDIQAEYSLKSEVNRLTELLKKNERNPQILVEIALLHYDRGDFTQAREYYQKALAIDPWLDIDDLENIK
jgi:tetratricopeptide (TPR) repeat protein